MGDYLKQKGTGIILVNGKIPPKLFDTYSGIWHNNCLVLRMELTMPKTNLHEELIKLKRKSNLKINLDFNPDKINSDKLFHIDEIKKICIDYRLRFLDFDYFKGKVPNEAYDDLKENRDMRRTTVLGEEKLI